MFDVTANGASIPALGFGTFRIPGPDVLRIVPHALKAGFRKGIPAPGPVDEVAAARMLAIMVDLGGAELMGDVTTLPEGLFFAPQP